MGARRERIGAAVVFAVALLSYILVFDRNFDSAAEIGDWLDNDLPMQYAGTIAIAIAGVAFLLFLGQLRDVLRRIVGDGGSLPTLMYGAGVLFVGLLWVAAPIDVGIAEEVGSDIEINTYNALSNIAHQHLLYSQIAVAVLLAAIYVVGRKGGNWPGWVVVFTGVVAVTSVAQLILPFLVLLLPIWAVAFALGVPDTEN